MIEIRPFKLNDCISVAEAHANYLTTPFRGKAGIQLLKIYYEGIAHQMGGVGFLAVNDGKFSGFVCGIWDRPLIRRSLLKRWVKLAFYGIRQSWQVPTIIPGLLPRILNPFTTNVLKFEGYELRPMVVLPEYRGQGIANHLMLHLLNDAKRRGFKQVFLIVEINNFIAEKLYTRSGFKFEKQINISGNIVNLLRYSFSTEKVQ